MIEKQIQKLKGGITDSEKISASPEFAPVKELITFNDFSKMDIRVATILSAERVPKTDKLLKLTIDTGIDIRTIVSGIAVYFDPDKLKGKRVCVLVNLESRMIKGIESKGMVLLAENNDGSLYFIEPAVGALNGSEVK